MADLGKKLKKFQVKCDQPEDQSGMVFKFFFKMYSYEDIMNQFVWNNKCILCEGKSLYYAFLHNICEISS